MPNHQPSAICHRPFLAATLPVLAAVAVYLPALRNGFIWDDPTVLLQMRAIRSFGDLVVMPPIIPKFYYRPFIFVTYLIDRGLGGETPFWFHASGIAWHALTTLLVYLLARRLFPADWLIATGGALLFAVFPTHVESVAWMAGRSDIIVGALVLLTTLLYLDREHAWSAWLGGATYFVATLSKEMAVACVLLVPLLDLLATRRLYWARYLPLLIATPLYFVLRAHSIGAVVGGLPPNAAPVQLALDIVRALGFYSVRAVIPIGLCAYIPNVPASPIYLIAGLVIPMLAVVLVGLTWRRTEWAPAFLTVWFFLTLAPSLTVIVRRSASAIVADRYLYVPTVASCILGAWALVRLAQQRRLAPQWPAAAFVVLAGLFAFAVIPYSRVWSDNFTFWSDVAAKVPDDALPHRELASALINRGDLQGAEREFQRALASPSDREGQFMTYTNLGNLYRRLRRYDDAQHAFEAAMQLGAHPALYHNLGMALMSKIEQEQADPAAVQRDIVKARDAFEQALTLGSRPGAPQAFLEWDGAKTHALLGQVLFSMGDRAGAREHLEAALRLEPNGPVADATRLYMRKLEH
jgi:predicted negative regulator of RcsB-dependent stress response